MAVASQCPDPQQLQQLLLGRSSEEAAERLEEHVEHCDRCRRLLPTLPAEDRLVEAMRNRPQFTLPPAEQTLIQSLLPRLHQLRAALPTAAEVPRGDPASFPFLR